MTIAIAVVHQGIEDDGSERPGLSEVFLTAEKEKVRIF